LAQKKVEIISGKKMKKVFRFFKPKKKERLVPQARPYLIKTTPNAHGEK